MTTTAMQPLRATLTPYLDDLEARIDDAVETELHAQWRQFLDGQFKGAVFSPRRSRVAPPSLPWPTVSINEGLDDFAQMALQQFASASAALAAGDGTILNVRSNYGTAILAAPFGVELFIMDASHNTLPTNWPLKGGLDAIRRRLDQGLPDIHSSLAGKALEMGRIYADLIAPYPRIRKHVQVFHPDTQSPMDICELLWGSAIFTDILDHPKVVLELLELITQTYIRFMDEWVKIIPFRPSYNAHWGLLIKGCLMLRSDSAMNLSPKMYDQFIRPFDQRLLQRYGGGAVHFCGRGDHFIRACASMEGLTGINTSQPEYNNMETIFQQTVDRGINLLALQGGAARAAVEAGRNLHGRVHSSDALLEKIGHGGTRDKR